MEALEYDRKLMYIMLDNRGALDVYEQCKELHNKGLAAVKEKLEYSKYNLRHQDKQKELSSRAHYVKSPEKTVFKKKASNNLEI